VQVNERTIPARVAVYLDLHHVITLSTSSFTGMPHADTVVFACDDQRILFYGFEGTTLARNIRDSRHVSFSVDDYTVEWRKVRELQGVGTCRKAEEGDEAIVDHQLRRKIGPNYTRLAGDLYAITPLEMHFVDYEYDEIANSETPEMRDQLFQFQAPGVNSANAAVSTALDQTTFEPGEVIFRPGEGRGRYYVVVAGEVEVRAEGHGADQTVVRVGTGQMFGDQAAFRGQQGQLTAHAVARTTLLAVSRDSIRDMML
jgi:Cyclic nucleotide-binding domain/Pyridoxamine 5'-phosphate oxidase